jgi:hypothetical protein
VPCIRPESIARPRKPAAIIAIVMMSIGNSVWGCALYFVYS